MKTEFDVGDAVTVLSRDVEGHTRTPRYIMGCRGRVERRLGLFLSPEGLAVGRTAGPVLPLYRVEFPLTELWPDTEASLGDTIVVEIYENWLVVTEAA